MNYLKSIRLILLFSFLFTCLQATPMSLIDSEATVVETISDDDKAEVILINPRIARAETCEDKLGKNEDHKCRVQCGEIYSRRVDRRDCKDLTLTQINSLAMLHNNILKDPIYDELKKINLEDFEVYINIAPSAFSDLVGEEYSPREAKRFLIWVLNDEKVTKIIQDGDYEYEILETLLLQVMSFGRNEVELPFLEIKPREGGENLIGLAVNQNNEVALGWFQEFIFATDTGCGYELSIDCFQAFCKIGADFHVYDRYPDDLLDYGWFEAYIDDTIDKGTNGASVPNANEWDTNYIEDSFDVDDWVDDLCGGLT